MSIDEFFLKNGNVLHAHRLYQSAQLLSCNKITIVVYKLAPMIWYNYYFNYVCVFIILLRV